MKRQYNANQGKRLAACKPMRTEPDLFFAINQAAAKAGISGFRHVGLRSGEYIVTPEKLAWLVKTGERDEIILQPCEALFAASLAEWVYQENIGPRPLTCPALVVQSGS